MMVEQYTKFLFLFFCLIILSNPTQANNGAIAYAYPISDIIVDGDFSDWPANAKKYPIAHHLYGYQPKSKDDIGGHFRIGYDLKTQTIYVAVEMWDNAYIRNKENPQYWAHDMQVLYIDPQHKVSGNGVLALEVNEYFRKIVDQEQNWDPWIKSVTWDHINVSVKQEGKQTCYEWKIKLDGFIKEGNSIGFDYVVFDKDSPEGDSHMIGWGKDEGIKHECPTCLGDIVLMPSERPLAEIKGKLSPKDPKSLPQRLNLQSVDHAKLRLGLRVDSLGNFSASVPPGSYTLTAISGLKWFEVDDDDEVYQLVSKGETTLQLVAGENPFVKPNIVSEVLSKPSVEVDKGVLFDFNPDKPDALHEFIQTYMNYYEIPGASLALIKDGKLFYHHTYGSPIAGTQNKVTENTMFEAASVTKPVFGFVVNKLVERNVIDLDKPLHEYLPFEDLEEDHPEYKTMTARHVLTHKTGLPNWGTKMQAKPGEKFGYSGEGFEYLKRVVQKVTGKPIEQVIREELIDPLQLNHMEFTESDYLKKHAAIGHIDGKPTVRMIPKEPGMAWSMYTEAKAFSDFALAIMHRKGLKAETYKSMLAFHTEIPQDEGEFEEHREGFGLGIGVGESQFGKTFFHSGNNGDFQCIFQMYDELKMGYILFTNANTGDFLVDEIGDFLVEGKKE